ncbi:hypothetical protein C8039_03920 [Halogeometricum sp. wsp3]|nr:hypothetical protein C8039_03920 [Halogeometricum sp. wsp3]
MRWRTRSAGGIPSRLAADATGYASMDFNAWSPVAQYILLFAMFIGGSAGRPVAVSRSFAGSSSSRASDGNCSRLPIPGRQTSSARRAGDR